MSIMHTSSKASKLKDNSGTSAPVGSIAYMLQYLLTNLGIVITNVSSLASSVSSLITTVSSMVSGTSVRGMNVQIYTGASPFNVTANSNKDIFAIWNPAGLLATGTVNFPDGSYDGQRIVIKSLKIITLLTINVATGAIQGALGTLALGAFGEYAWSTTDATWYKVG